MPDTIPGHPHTAPASGPAHPALDAALLIRITETSHDLASVTARPCTAPATAPSRRQQDTSTADDQHRDITATVQAECQHLQALEDAIAYRRARVTAPCPDCTASGQKCDDHACDLNLITAYQRTAIAILDASSRTDVSRPGGSRPAARGNHPAGLHDETWPAKPGLPGVR
jgi:hypothetical protein